MLKLITIIILLAYTNGYSQWNIGMNLKDAKKEIMSYYNDIKISQEYMSNINSVVLKYNYMYSQIICYFKNQICYLQIIIPNKISAYNEWIRIFNEVLRKNGDNKWVSFAGGKTTYFGVEYWEKYDTNIIRIYEDE